MLASDGARGASVYRLFGLNLRSQIGLAGLAPAADGGEADVEVVFGTVPPGDYPQGYSATADGTLLAVAKVGRYFIRAGREIVVGGPGTTVDCTVTAAGNPADAARIVGTVTDDAGTVAF